MLTLVIPSPLKQEFATVEALWQSTASTRGVDSLVLSWIKYEKQLRRIFCFLVFQHPDITSDTITSAVTDLSQHNRIYAETFIRGIAALGVPPIPVLVGADHAKLDIQLKRIKKYRNKIVHGQVTGQNITSRQLEQDVQHIVRWVTALARGADLSFGYDGLRRNTFLAAKANKRIAVANFPFSSPVSFGKWLRTL